MKAWWILAAAAALLALSGAAHAELALHIQSDPGPTGDATIEDVIADAGRDVVYALHWEGRVTAHDEATGERQWEWRFTEEPLFQAGASGEKWSGTTANGFDMVDDDGALYVTFINEADALSQPVVALSKDTGELIWWLDPGVLAEGIGHTPPFAGGPEIDAYGLAIDPVEAETNLYVGTAAGYIFKVDRTDASPVLEDGTLTPQAYRPDFEDVPIVPRPTSTTSQDPFGCSRESRIHSLDVYNGTFLAARNWGGADKQFQCHQLLATSINNTLIWGDTPRMDGVDILLPLTDQQDDTPVARPGLREVNVAHDEASDALDIVIGGQASGRSGYLTVIQDIPYGPAPTQFAGIFLDPGTEVYTFDDDSLVTPGPEDQNLTILGPDTGINGVAIDDRFVYGVTSENDTSDFPNAVPTAWALKFDRDTLEPASGEESWSSLDPQGDPRPGRSIETGGTGADISLDPDGPAWIGYSVGEPPWDDVGGFFQPRGALLLEVPRDDAPLAVWHISNGGEFSNGFLPFAYLTDYPRTSEPDLEARIEYREEPLDGETGDWRPLKEVVQAAVPANAYHQLNNVQLPGPQAMPDSVYRFRVTAEDDLGRTFTDESDGVLTLDRTAPALSIVEPYDPDHPQHLVTLTTDQPRFEVELSDSFTGIDDGTTGLWIDDMTRGYPLLEYVTDPDGRITGFVMDLGQYDPAVPAPNGAPTALADGQHTVRVEAWDMAGNFAFEQWVIEVDTGVRAPQFKPTAGVYQSNARPPIVAQFFEPGIEVIHATLDGQDVTQDVTVFPQHHIQNPEGAQVRLLPDAALSDRDPHVFAIQVRDAAGNEAGPFGHVVRVDTVSPEIDVGSPVPDSLISQARPEIAFTLADDVSGLDFDSIQVRLDGFSMADKLPGSSDRVTFRPDAPLQDGQHHVDVRVRDLAGNEQTASWTFQIDRTAPSVQTKAELPPGQAAVKAGDTVRVVATVQDASPLTSVTVDARGLDPSLSTAEPMALVVGSSDQYHIEIQVAQMRTKPIELHVRAVDAGGLETVAAMDVLVDNLAPIVFTKDLPGTTVGVFDVEWTNTPGDAEVGGSGIAYYIVEQQEHGSPWRVVEPQTTAVSWRASFVENEQTTLRFRVTGVDQAGNRGEPSNTVETETKGDPFQDILVSETLRVGTAARFSATPVDGADLDNSTVRVVMERDGQRYERLLDLNGRVFVGEWNLTDVPPGPYRLYFEFQAGNGYEVRAPGQDVTVKPAASVTHGLEPADKGSPGLAAVWLVGVLAAVVGYIRRR